MFYRSNFFTARKEGQRFYFIHSSGERVQSDELGKTIWEYLPAEEAEIIENVSKELKVESDLVRDFLEVMKLAGLVVSSPLENWNEVEPGRKLMNVSLKDEKRSKEEKENLVEGEVQVSDANVRHRLQRMVSAIVITYNSEEHIRACLGSLENQNYEPLEILVVDNASRDQTKEIIEKEFPAIRLIALNKNIYFPGAVNRGINAANGSYLLILNDDVVLGENCITRLVRRMEEEKWSAAACPMMKFYHLRGFINGIGNHIRDRGWGSDNFIGLVDCGQFHDLKEVPSACFGAVMLRKEAIGEIGLLDENYKSYYEDVDWSFRAWLKGWKIIAVPEAVVYHKFGSHWKESPEKFKLVTRNRLRLIFKMFSGKTLLHFFKNYIKEDLNNFISFLRRRKWNYLVSLLDAYVLLLLALFEIYWERRNLFRSFNIKTMVELYRSESPGRIATKKGEGEDNRTVFNVENILEKNPDFYSGLNEENIPVLDMSILRHYYQPCLKRIKNHLNSLY
jgi:GT2 family glycosyltransferase